VGVLFYDKDKNLQFLPDQHANYLIDSFGMTAVHAPVIVKAEQKPEYEESFETSDTAISITEPNTKLRIFKWRVLEVIPAAAMLAFLLMVPPVLENLNTNMGTLLPFSRMNEYVNELKGVEPTYKPFTYNYVSPFDVPAPPSKEAEIATEPANAQVVVNETQEATVSPIVPENESPTPLEPKAATNLSEEVTAAENTTIATTELSYHIIGGSFRSSENAKKLVAELKSKNIDAEIIGQNKAGLYLVSLLSSNNFTQISDALPEMKASAISTAWVYKK
jgi:uncharacterized surface protein with fasciclin (FAS1) repeats